MRPTLYRGFMHDLGDSRLSHYANAVLVSYYLKNNSTVSYYLKNSTVSYTYPSNTSYAVCCPTIGKW